MQGLLTMTETQPDGCPRKILRLQFVAVLSLLLFSAPEAAGPPLARLSFWLPPERMAEFEAVYRERVAPIVKRYGLVESSERGRATAVASRRRPPSMRFRVTLLLGS